MSCDGDTGIPGGTSPESPSQEEAESGLEAREHLVLKLRVLKYNTALTYSHPGESIVLNQTNSTKQKAQVEAWIHMILKPVMGASAAQKGRILPGPASSL